MIRPPHLSIRTKLLLGYAVMALSVLLLSAYSIVQFNRLNTIMSVSLTTGARLEQSAEQMASNLIEQAGIERKFQVTRDEAFARLLHESMAETSLLVEEVQHLARTGQAGALAADVARDYADYRARALVSLDSHGSGATGDERLQELLAAMTGTLQHIRTMAREQINGNMQRSRSIGRRGTQIALMLTAGSLLCWPVFALLIMRSIYQPLQRLKTATHYISHGDFQKKIEIATGDEIGELAESFNLMCDRLQRLDELKSDFISNITHDLKTPLATITEATQLLIEGAAGNITEAQQHLLDIVKTDTARLLRLIETIIDLAKMESGLLTYNTEPVQVECPVAQALRSVQLLARQKNIRMQYGLETNLPEVLIDTDKITQALINVLGNAIKFTPTGGRVLVDVTRAAPEDCGPPGTDISLTKAVQISISDTGPGIAREDLPLIFDKFYQGHAAQEAHGDGLGLAIVRHIVQAHRGHVWVESEPGRGSTFLIQLPARPA